MSEEKRGFWARLFGKKYSPPATSPEPPIVVPKIELSPDRSWSVKTDDGAVDAVYLRQQMSNFLTQAQLHQIARQYAIDPDTLEGGKGRQVLIVITAVTQQNQLADLLERCQKRYPDVRWQLDDTPDENA